MPYSSAFQLLICRCNLQLSSGTPVVRIFVSSLLGSLSAVLFGTNPKELGAQSQWTKLSAFPLNEKHPSGWHFQILGSHKGGRALGR